MKNCKNCGKPLDDNDRFCTVCGEDCRRNGAPTAEEEARRESEFCASYKRILRYESRALKIIGIVYLVITIALAVLTFVLMGSDSITLPDELVMLITGGEFELTSYLFSCTLYYCVVSAINVILAKRTEACYDAFDCNIAKTVRHYGSFLSLFFCIMFNNIALIFYIINFIKTRSNAALVTKLIFKQREKEGDFTK